ncbi:MAG: hypothetical protein ACR2QO_16910 [Acidimicrobiales bacterium]
MKQGLIAQDWYPAGGSECSSQFGAGLARGDVDLDIDRPLTGCCGVLNPQKKFHDGP